MQTLRVGLFTECYRPIQNGIVASIDSLAHALRARGNEAIVVTPEMPNYKGDDNDVVRVRSLPLPTRTSYRLTMPHLPRAIGALSLVHTHSPFVTGWLGQRAARRSGVPLVFTYHTQLEEYAHYIPFESRTTRNVASQLTRSYANLADAVVVPTAAMSRRLRELGVRARIEVVPSGIDVAMFARGRRDDAIRARFGISSQDTMLLFVGRLGREKNVELAIEAAARIGDERAHLVIVGDGAHREMLERFAARAGAAARTHFAGECARDDLPDIYASADVFVFPSSTDTQGMVLAEAMAAGLAVVAVDTPQTRDVLGDGARIVPRDAAALAEGLRATIAAPGVGARGAAGAVRYDRVALGNRVLELYASLLDGPLSHHAASA